MFKVRIVAPPSPHTFIHKCLHVLQLTAVTPTTVEVGQAVTWAATMTLTNLANLEVTCTLKDNTGSEYIVTVAVVVVVVVVVIVVVVVVVGNAML